MAYENTDFFIAVTPANYDSKRNFLDAFAMKFIIELVCKVNSDVIFVVKSAISEDILCLFV